MLREVIHPTQKCIILKLPDEYVNQEIEILAFSVHEKNLSAPSNVNRYPLRGLPVSYRQPFECVAAGDAMIVLDIHIRVWWAHGDLQLPQAQADLIKQHEPDAIGVSAVPVGRAR